MDIHRMIRELHEERRHLERIIESLESIAKMGGGYIKPPGRRGRKFMDAADREEVSARMKRYWARRRAERAEPPGETPKGPSALGLPAYA